MTKLVLEPAYVLHTRAFSETSVIAQIWTKTLGRLSVLVKGYKRPKSRMRGLITPFMGLHVSAVGRSELLTLTGAEIYQPLVLHGQALMSGLYLNELLYKALPTSDPFEDLFDHYQQVLKDLLSDDLAQVQWALRSFEFHVLQALGYGIDLKVDSQNRPIEESQTYHFQPDVGLVKVASPQSPSISGQAVHAFRQGKLVSQHLKSYKWLMQTAIANMLVGQKINTREIVRGIGELS